MPPRQQRTPNNRGQLQTPNRRPVPDVVWELTDLTGNVVTVALVVDPTQIVEQGIPPFLDSSNTALPVSMVRVGTILQLTYTAPPMPGADLVLASAQPGIRTISGAYLAAGRQRLQAPPSPPPPTATQAWTASLVAPGTVLVSPSSGNTFGLVVSFANWKQNGSDLHVTSIVNDSADLQLTFADLINVGDTFGVSALNLTNGDSILYVLATDSVVL